MDLTFAAMDAAYLRALQTYARALAERNALLGAAAEKARAAERAEEEQRRRRVKGAGG